MIEDSDADLDPVPAAAPAMEPDSQWIIAQLRAIAERSSAGNKKEDLQIALRALELLARERGLFARPSVRPRRLSDLPMEELRAALARLEPR